MLLDVMRAAEAAGVSVRTVSKWLACWRADGAASRSSSPAARVCDEGSSRRPPPTAARAHPPTALGPLRLSEPDAAAPFLRQRQHVRLHHPTADCPCVNATFASRSLVTICSGLCCRSAMASPLSRSAPDIEGGPASGGG